MGWRRGLGAGCVSASDAFITRITRAPLKADPWPRISSLNHRRDLYMRCLAVKLPNPKMFAKIRN